MCGTVIDLDRLEQILIHYDLSAECILKDRPDEVVFRIQLLDWHKLPQFYSDLCAFAVKLEKAAENKESTMCLLVNSLRLFHVVDFDQLPYFVLYLYYYQSLSPSEDDVVTYEVFCDELEKYDFRSVFASVHRSLEKMPSREIWGESVLDVFLFYIKDIGSRNYFEDPANKRLILEELTGFVNAFFDRVAIAVKPSGARFDFFKGPYNDGKGMLLVRSGKEDSFVMKLESDKTMITRNPFKLIAQAEVFNKRMDISMALGLGNQWERVQFKDLLLDKIKKVMLHE